MSAIHPQPELCKLIVGVLYSQEDAFAEALRRMELDFGAIDLRSPTIPFDMTTYYNEEMGENIQRLWIAFETLMNPGQLAKAKLHTNRMEEWLEQKFRAEGAGRPVNLDPGYVGMSKLILASAKDFSHRIYLRDGIFAELTLRWSRKRGFEAAGDWTYADYGAPAGLEFFNSVRKRYKEQIEACR
jgi:hypothetical protein